MLIWLFDAIDVVIKVFFAFGVLIGTGFVLVILTVGYVLLDQAYARATNRRPGHWWRARRGKGLGVDELARRLDMPADELKAVVAEYTERFIEKSNGEARQLHVPSPELKAVQKKILKGLLARLRVHAAATGFEPGTSIVHNAIMHTHQAVVICLDVRDFFPSTSAERVDAYFRRIGWNREAAALLTRLTTFEGGLPQGASTSPRLSNLVNYALDSRLDRFAQRRKATYTRYADDICFSYPKDFPKKIRGTLQVVRRHLKYFGYEVHPNKTRILRQHQRQKVTGLVVNDRVNVPRHIRRKLRAVEHRLNNGRPATMTREQLSGWKAFLTMVEKQRDES